MTDYAEMAKLAKRIEFLESREVISGADSWLKLEKRITVLEDRPWNPCRTCNGKTCANGKEFPGLRKQVENNWLGGENPACHSDEVEQGETSLACGNCIPGLPTRGQLHILCPFLHEWRRPTDTCPPHLIDTLTRLGIHG